MRTFRLLKKDHESVACRRACGLLSECHHFAKYLLIMTTRWRLIIKAHIGSKIFKENVKAKEKETDAVPIQSWAGLSKSMCPYEAMSALQEFHLGVVIII